MSELVDRDRHWFLWTASTLSAVLLAASAPDTGGPMTSKTARLWVVRRAGEPLG